MRYIPIHICSRLKSSKKIGYLNELYLSDNLKCFFKAFIDYVILSRKYGICFSGKIYENYSDADEKNDDEMMKMLLEQSKDPIYREITFVYYNHRPMTHGKWIKMLRDAGFNVIERRSVSQIKEFLASRERTKGSIDSWLK